MDVSSAPLAPNASPEQKGDALYKAGKFFAAEKEYENAVKQENNSSHDINSVKLRNKLARSYRQLLDRRSVIKHRGCLNDLKKIDLKTDSEKSLLATTFNDLGVANLHVDQSWQQAFVNHYNAFNIRLAGGIPREIASSLNNMGWTKFTQVRDAGSSDPRQIENIIKLGEIGYVFRNPEKPGWGIAGSHYFLAFFKSYQALHTADPNLKDKLLQQADQHVQHGYAYFKDQDKLGTAEILDAAAIQKIASDKPADAVALFDHSNRLRLKNPVDRASGMERPRPKTVEGLMADLFGNVKSQSEQEFESRTIDDLLGHDQNWERIPSDFEAELFLQQSSKKVETEKLQRFVLDVLAA